MAHPTVEVPMRLLAWCLMPNHFRLVLWTHADGDLSRRMHWLANRHMRRYHSIGHLWQGRVKGFAIQHDEHLLRVLINLNVPFFALSRHEGSVDSPVEVKVVDETFVRTAPILSLLIGCREVRTTAEHPFFVKGKGWVGAKELCARDVLSSHDGQWVTVEAVTDLNEVATVYNLRVSDYHTYFVGSREWGFSVWAHNTCYEVRAIAEGRFGLFNRATGEAVTLEGRAITANSVEGVRLLATDAARIESSAISNVVRTTGTDVRGAFVRLDVASGENVLESTLRGTALEVDWVNGSNMVFNLGQVQTAAGGPGTIRTITGYVTDQMAVNVRQPGYVQRLADAVGGRLGGQWTGRLEASGNRTYLVLERAP